MGGYDYVAVVPVRERTWGAVRLGESAVEDEGDDLELEFSSPLRLPPHRHYTHCTPTTPSPC